MATGLSITVDPSVRPLGQTIGDLKQTGRDNGLVLLGHPALDPESGRAIVIFRAGANIPQAAIDALSATRGSAGVQQYPIAGSEGFEATNVGDVPTGSTNRRQNNGGTIAVVAANPRTGSKSLRAYAPKPASGSGLVAEAALDLPQPGGVDATARYVSYEIALRFTAQTPLTNGHHPTNLIYGLGRQGRLRLVSGGTGTIQCYYVEDGITIHLGTIATGNSDSAYHMLKLEADLVSGRRRLSIDGTPGSSTTYSAVDPSLLSLLMRLETAMDETFADASEEVH